MTVIERTAMNALGRVVGMNSS